MNNTLSRDPITTVTTESVAEAYLALLKDRGIDYMYVNAGTDTAPIIEAYARAESAGLVFPKPVVTLHENVAVGMAHGYYMASRRPQAVMLHVSVGAANAVCGLINAARAQVPILFTAGRTPLFEEGRLGSRTHEVHWAQEMFDQGAMVREIVKWDYELKDGLNVEQVLDRALSISMSEPRGPVYLTLPREVLAQERSSCKLGEAYDVPSSPHPDPVAVERLARALLGAEKPVIVCMNSGADPTTVPLLVELAERFGIGVVENRPRYLCFPGDHPLHMGYDAAGVLPHADALLFLENDVPWIPSASAPLPDAFVSHGGSDPLYSRYPVRSFRSDLTIMSNPIALLRSLTVALATLDGESSAQSRRGVLQELARNSKAAATACAQADHEAGGPITKVFFTSALASVLPDDAILVNEYAAVRDQLTLTRPESIYHFPSSGGLGWGLPAALGVKQASADRLVVAVVGDGSYVFANPAACHHASAMHNLPVLTLVYNNERWDAVQKATLGMYPSAHTRRHIVDKRPLPMSSLGPQADFERYVEASGGHGERVTSREELVPALRRAMEVVRNERRQALVNVIGV